MVCRRYELPASSPSLLTQHRRQDLLGNALIGELREASLVDLSNLFSQAARLLPPPAQNIPVGFVKHHKVISDEVLVCIGDIVHLQTFGAVETSDHATIFELQASIECSLVFHEQTCRDFGLVSECCRLAAFIVCYMSYKSTWNASFVPLRVSEKLLVYLNMTTHSDLWLSRRDLMLWLLLVGASACKAENCFAGALTSRYEELIKRITHEVKGWTDLQSGPGVLHTAMEGFVYAQLWVSRRCSIGYWTELESTILSSGSSAS